MTKGVHCQISTRITEGRDHWMLPMKSIGLNPRNITTAFTAPHRRSRSMRQRFPLAIRGIIMGVRRRAIQRKSQRTCFLFRSHAIRNPRRNSMVTATTRMIDGLLQGKEEVWVVEGVDEIVEPVPGHIPEGQALSGA